MELHHSHSNILSSLSLTFFLHFSSLLFPSSSYTLPDYYFINCGSHSSLPTFQRNFTGDQNPSTFSLSSTGTTSSAANQTLELYQTARVFTKPSSYHLNLDQTGTYILRLHFFPSPSLENPQFHVSAAGFSLLSNFTAGRYGFPIVEEFLIKASAGKLKINFNPAQKDRSSAFVNAIEVFLAPPELIPDYASVPIPRVSSNQGDNGYFNGVLGDFTLRILHRINVGGGNVTRESDTLMRYWVPDDPYLLPGNTSKSHTYTDEIKYQDGGATTFIAPDSVYNTAREMNTNSSDNISWRFEVKKGVSHLLRLHFCDIVSDTSNENFKFNLFVDGDEPIVVFPWDKIPQGAAPFYIDRLVETDDSGFVNVSVGPNSESSVRNAMLNGLEIMELLTDKASDSGDGSGKGLFLILGLCIGGLVLVLVVFGVVFLRFRKRKVKQNGVLNWPLGSSYSRTTARTSVTGTPFADLNLGLKIPLSGILFATKHFDAKLMIGEGGFGKVYKGTLRNGNKVAIKRSEAGHGQGFEEFHTEIRVLSKIRHQHLVSLIGYCDEKDEMILVYEFMENGTLREHLYGDVNRSLSWDERLRICCEAAKGIHYLHTGSTGTIIHRDIKSTNILLDESYVAKVADFGLSHSGPLDQTHVSTEVKGSFGYLDPEYFRCLQLTQKSDVYSFGVVLLEVLCARPAVDQELPREEVNLADWGMVWQRKGELEKVVDPCLEGKINPNSLRKFGETVEKCLQENGGDRPNMVDVLWDLEYCRQLQHSAVPRQPYEDTTTEVSWGVPMPVLQRLPTDSFTIEEDDSVSRSFSGVVSSQPNGSEVFSLLDMDGAR
ncbi:probable receptor-like protein kinase At5g24010 [Salvia hispanica]|uniref:probable receptor-like protein kinase At5g24010 n=1 Tax=Salvia hispanica TaxID=49212 RepID=UPI0020091B63|nr:probable receptor-like protein kinase At5g24010 [Salvia hispanica]